MWGDTNELVLDDGGSERPVSNSQHSQHDSSNDFTRFSFSASTHGHSHSVYGNLRTGTDITSDGGIKSPLDYNDLGQSMGYDCGKELLSSGRAPVSIQRDNLMLDERGLADDSISWGHCGSHYATRHHLPTLPKLLLSEDIIDEIEWLGAVLMEVKYRLEQKLEPSRVKALSL